MKITKIIPTFFRCAETHGRKGSGVTVIPSTWSVSFSDGTKKTYNITLSPDKLDPKYDSRKDAPKDPEDYYIQVDGEPKFIEKLFKGFLTEGSFDRATTDPKDHLLCPKYGKGRPLFFYVISPKDFAEVPKEDFENVLKKTKEIDEISKTIILNNKPLFFSHKVSEEELDLERPETIKRIRQLDLHSYESQLLFHDLFEKSLINYIQKKDPSIIDARATERTHLLDEESFSLCSVIKEIFADIFCCKCLP